MVLEIQSSAKMTCFCLFTKYKLYCDFVFDATNTTRRRSEEKEERVRIILRVVWKVSTVCVNRHIYFIHMYFARVVSATVPPTDIRLTVFLDRMTMDIHTIHNPTPHQKGNGKTFNIDEG